MNFQKLLVESCLIASLSMLSMCSVIKCVEQRSPEGKLFIKACFDKHGLKQGAYSEYFETGQVMYEANYRNDSLDGLFRRYYPTGELNYAIEFRSNRIWKVLVQNHPDGSPRQEMTLDRGNGMLSVFDDNGKLVRYGPIVDGFKHGYWKSLGRQGIVDSVEYSMGRRSSTDQLMFLP